MISPRAYSQRKRSGRRAADCSTASAIRWAVAWPMPAAAPVITTVAPGPSTAASIASSAALRAASAALGRRFGTPRPAPLLLKPREAALATAQRAAAVRGRRPRVL